MHEYSGKCSCGEVQVKLVLPKTLSNYAPRACDCDFCQIHKIKYISDPAGIITLFSQLKLNQYQQGSEQATFLQCPVCETLLLAKYTSKNNSLASLNANIIELCCELQPSIIISPKHKSSVEKVNRWQQLWSKLITLN